MNCTEDTSLGKHYSHWALEIKLSAIFFVGSGAGKRAQFVRLCAVAQAERTKKYGNPALCAHRSTIPRTKTWCIAPITNLFELSSNLK